MTKADIAEHIDATTDVTFKNSNERRGRIFNSKGGQSAAFAVSAHYELQVEASLKSE